MLVNQRVSGCVPDNKRYALYNLGFLKKKTQSALWPVSAFFLLFLFNVFSQLASAATLTQWQTVAANQVSVKISNPVSNRRSADATVSINLANISGKALTGPFRLVLTNLTPVGSISIGNASGSIDAGEAYFDLTAYLGKDIPVSGNGVVTVIVKGGGAKPFNFGTRLEQQVPQNLTINITSPASLLTVGSTPQTVKGSVSDPSAQITLNGAPVTNNKGSFEAAVSLTEGSNTITARATDAYGHDVSDIITLSLDMTPPYITVDTPQDGSIVRAASINVSGLINDIVRGTVSPDQAQVSVNGVNATVSNRSYLATNVALTQGDNVIKIVGADHVGNTSSISLKVKYQPLAPQHIELLSGQGQTGTIKTALSQALKIKLLDQYGKPVANKPVIFRVTQGDGVVGGGSEDQGQGTLVQTDDQGVASTSFQLGTRAGIGNQRVRAAAVGFDGEVLFYASAGVGKPNKVTVNSGNNQRGGAGQQLPQPLVVAVIDSGANVVSGAQVQFDVTQGSGKFQNGKTSIVVATDSDGRAATELTLGPETGLDAQRATATLVGSSLYAGFTESALAVTTTTGQTSISGVVLDNQDKPLPGVTIRVEGTTRQAQADAQGQFKITEVPVGSVHLIADGSTTTTAGEWPTLAFNLVTVAGADNPLSAPIYLVKLNTATAQTVGDKDVTLTLPDVPGFALDVKAGSVTFPDGKKTGKLSVTPVNVSKIPMPPPNGMQPQFIVTIQPVGAKFDPPAALTLPNADGHLPGAQVEMYSYDHDLEEFVAIGLGTVSADGRLIKSNPGVGVIKAGWHCGSQPSGSGCCTNPGECQTTDANCQIVPDDSQTPSSLSDSPGDCSKPGCRGGAPTQVPNDADVPTADYKNDCKKPGCKNGSPKDQPDDADISPIDAQCSSCKDMAIKPDPAKDKASCGDGSDKQSCFVCKDGRCGLPTCPVDQGNDNVIRFSESNPGAFGDFANKMKSVINSIPNINVRKVSIEPRGELATGQRCCKDCRMSNPVSDYVRINLYGNMEIIGGATYGPSIDFNQSYAYRGYGINVALNAYAGVRLEVSLQGNAGGYGEYLYQCQDNEGCIALTGGASIGFRPTAGIEIKQVAANVLWAGQTKPIVDVSAAATIGMRIGQSGAQANLPLYGNNCPSSCTYSLGAIQGDIKVSVKISLIGYTILNPPDIAFVHVFWNGITGSC